MSPNARRPAGPAPSSCKDISWVIGNLKFFQESNILFLKRTLAMVLLLILDVGDDIVVGGFAHRERRVTLLPCEGRVELVLGESGRVGFDEVGEVGDRDGRRQRTVNVNVVF